MAAKTKVLAEQFRDPYQGHAEMNIGKISHSLTESATVAEVEAVLPESELAELDAIGDSLDDGRWKAGDTARLWVDVRKLPQDQCLSIIARRTDWGKESIRKFLYCSRFYFERSDLRKKYSILRHSIFNHARQCAEPEKVLQAAFDNRLSPTVTKNSFPILMDEFRETYTRVPKRFMDEARTIIETALMKLRELTEKE